MSLSKLRELSACLKDRQTRRAAAHGIPKLDTADGLNHHKLDERTCNEFSKTITQGKTQREFITLLIMVKYT